MRVLASPNMLFCMGGVVFYNCNLNIWGFRTVGLMIQKRHFKISPWTCDVYLSLQFSDVGLLSSFKLSSD